MWKRPQGDEMGTVFQKKAFLGRKEKFFLKRKRTIDFFFESFFFFIDVSKGDTDSFKKKHAKENIYESF